MKTGICCSKVLCHEPVRDDTHRHEVTRTGHAATTGSLWQEFSFSMNQSIDYPSSVNSAFTVTPNTLEHLLGMIRSPLYSLSNRLTKRTVRTVRRWWTCVCTLAKISFPSGIVFVFVLCPAQAQRRTCSRWDSTPELTL
jgi:hypothetical protein